jgi:hypothetical protein
MFNDSFSRKELVGVTLILNLGANGREGYTQGLAWHEGGVFSRGLSTHSLCCQSRHVTLLTHLEEERRCCWAAARGVDDADIFRLKQILHWYIETCTHDLAILTTLNNPPPLSVLVKGKRFSPCMHAIWRQRSDSGHSPVDQRGPLRR